MTVSLKQSAPYFYVKSNVRCQFGLTCSPLLHVFPCFPGGGVYRGKIAKVESYFVSMSSCLPATGAACFLRLLLERHRGFPDLVGETSSLQHDLVHPGVSSRLVVTKTKLPPFSVEEQQVYSEPLTNKQPPLSFFCMKQ